MLVTSTEVLKGLGLGLGLKVKRLRIAKGYTQEYVAEHINISADLLRNIENSRNIGSVPTLLNLCNLLEITMNDLFIDFISEPKNSIDNTLYQYLKNMSKENKQLLKNIIIHIDKNY